MGGTHSRSSVGPAAPSAGSDSRLSSGPAVAPRLYARDHSPSHGSLPHRRSRSDEEGSHVAFEASGSASAKDMMLLRVRCGNAKTLEFDAQRSMELEKVKVMLTQALYRDGDGYLAPKNMRLVYNTKVLPNTGTLAENGVIEDGAKLFMATVRDGAGRRFVGDEEKERHLSTAMHDDTHAPPANQREQSLHRA